VKSLAKLYFSVSYIKTKLASKNILMTLILADDRENFAKMFLLLKYLFSLKLSRNYSMCKTGANAFFCFFFFSKLEPFTRKQREFDDFRENTNVWVIFAKAKFHQSTGTLQK
jgi:hypothetical protein